MFYLLEDNRIIDSEKDKFFDLRTRLGVLLEIDGETIIGNKGKIKKQSENVYDLIEVGDLVTEKRIWCNEEVYVIANVCSKEDKLIHCFHSTLFENDVSAIYKPDSQGNYIKVWEKKKDE